MDIWKHFDTQVENVKLIFGQFSVPLLPLKMAEKADEVGNMFESLLSTTNEDTHVESVDDFDPFSGVVEINNEYVDVDLNAPPESQFVFLVFITI